MPFDDLYRRHFRETQRWLRYLGVQPGDVEDEAQRVFEVVLSRIDDFDGQREKPWLFSITRRIASNYRRSKWLRGWLGRRGEAPPVLFAVRADKEGAIHDRLLAEKALYAMSEKLRTAFILFEIEGYSVEEIATLLQIPTGTVSSRLRLARERFLLLVERGSP